MRVRDIQREYYFAWMLRRIADAISDISSFPRARESEFFKALPRGAKNAHACMKFSRFGKHVIPRGTFDFQS